MTNVALVTPVCHLWTPTSWSRLKLICRDQWKNTRRGMEKYTAWVDKNFASVDQNVDQQAREG
ncbi:MAG: hypothetical protein ACXADB_13415 [Candidatus Hermodarchaeia archaeon]